jgi:hypothetical protein
MTQFQHIDGNDLVPFDQAGKQVILYPSKIKSGDLVHPFALDQNWQRRKVDIEIAQQTSWEYVFLLVRSLKRHYWSALLRERARDWRIVHSRAHGFSAV